MAPRDTDRSSALEASGARGPVLQGHRWLGEHVGPGDRCVDATCGRGRDLLFLRRLVGPTGRVFGLDIQAEALAACAALQREAVGALGDYRLLRADHARLAEAVDSDWIGATAAVVFNLGYLPSGDRRIVTRSASTLAGLDASLEFLRPGGVLVVVAYPGHPAGVAEARAVARWFREVGAGKGTLLGDGREPEPGAGPLAFGLRLARASG